MRKKRSPYSPYQPDDDQDGYQSPYAVPDPEEEGQGPLMRQAMAQKAQNEAAASRGYGGGGGQVAELVESLASPGPVADPSAESVSRYTSAADTSQSDSSSWVDEAPEAAGAARHSTTPQEAAPRSTVPITKDDIPKIGQGASERSQANPWRTKVAETDAQIARLNKDMGSWGTAIIGAGVPGVQRNKEMRMTSLLRQRAAFEQSAQYADDRRGASEKYKADQATARSLARTEASKYSADQRNAAEKMKREALSPANTRIDKQGRAWWTNPETHTLEPVPTSLDPSTAKGNVLDADNPERPEYAPPSRYAPPSFEPSREGGGAGHYTQEVNDRGDVTTLKNGVVVSTVKGAGKSRDVTPRETPEQKRAAMVAEDAGRAYDRDPDAPQFKGMSRGAVVAKAYEDALKTVKGKFQKYEKGDERAGKDPQGRPVTLVYDGKGNWIPKGRLGFARGH